MSLFEDFFISAGQEILYGLFKWIGVFIKWLFYLGKKSISQIKNENWNTRIGFLVFILSLLSVIIYFNNV